MAIYGTSSGGKKHTIGSDKGKDFINNAKAGDTLTGADGSTWTKNKDGSTTIVQNGVSYNVGGASRPSGSSGSSGSSTSSGGGYTGTFHDYSKPSGNWTPNAPKYTGGNAELDAYLALKSQEYYDAKSRNDARGMAEANDAANQARNYFGYAAELATEDINKVILGGSPTGAIGGGTFPQFSYQGAPQYVSQWDSIIQDLADQILNREPFTYNYLEDPNYIALKGMYTREGDRAMQDTLGSVAARTGGMASSYAASAASQANNYFMSQLSDKIPELQQIAYDAYMAGIDSKRDDLSMLMGLESTDYSRYLDSLSQWNTDRNFGYGVWRDQVNDQRYEDELAYDKNLAMAQMMAQVGDFSGLAGLWGMSDDQVQMLVDAYSKEKQMGDSQAARELADWYAQYGDFSKLKDLGVDTSYLMSSRYSSSGDGSSSDGRDDAGKVGSLAADALDWASRTGGDPEDFIRAYYKDYGYSSQSQALAALAVYEVENPAEITGPNQLGATARTLYDNMVRRYTSANRTSFASDIKNALNAGRITEAEADFILAAIGF